MPYNLPNGQYPYPLNYLASDGGIVVDDFVYGDPTVEPDSNNWFILCLTPQQMIDVKSLVEVGAPIAFPDSYNSMFYMFDQMFQFPNQIPENSCMDLCQLIIDCIGSNTELQQLIASTALALYPEPTQEEIPGLLGVDLFQGQAVECDNDNIFGATTQLVDLLNVMSEDVLELFVTVFAAPGRAGDIIEAIPGIGLLPFDDALQFLEKLATQVNDAYQAAYDSQLRDDFRCALFCIARDNDCVLTMQDARDWFKSQITEAVEGTDFLTLVNDIIANNWIGEQSIYMMHWFLLDALVFGSEILGIDVNRVAVQVATFFNDPDSDWELLCQCVAELCIGSDFASQLDVEWGTQDNSVGNPSPSLAWEFHDDATFNRYDVTASLTFDEVVTTERLKFDYMPSGVDPAGFAGLSLSYYDDNDDLIRMYYDDPTVSEDEWHTFEDEYTVADVKRVRWRLGRTVNKPGTVPGTIYMDNICVVYQT